MSNNVRANPRNLIAGRVEQHPIRCGRFDPVNQLVSEGALVTSADPDVNVFLQFEAVRIDFNRSQFFPPRLLKNTTETNYWPKPVGM